MSPKDAAQWMIDEVRRVRFLDHARVIGHLLAEEPKLVEHSAEGSPKVGASVLRAFGKREGDDIVWSRSALHWRLREAGDLPGRSVP